MTDFTALTKRTEPTMSVKPSRMTFLSQLSQQLSGSNRLSCTQIRQKAKPWLVKMLSGGRVTPLATEASEQKHRQAKP